jgi:hypothetical protein
MSKDKYRSADLILKLYELRREETMRKARDWMAMGFFPESADDLFQTLMGSNSAYYRMVVSYWDMACSFVTGGAIDHDMFTQANGEHIFVFAKIQPFLKEIRERSGNPNALSHLEQVVKDTPGIDKRLEAVRTLMQQLKARYAAQESEAASLS